MLIHGCRQPWMPEEPRPRSLSPRVQPEECRASGRYGTRYRGRKCLGLVARGPLTRVDGVWDSDTRALGWGWPSPEPKLMRPEGCRACRYRPAAGHTIWSGPAKSFSPGYRQGIGYVSWGGGLRQHRTACGRRKYAARSEWRACPHGSNTCGCRATAG